MPSTLQAINLGGQTVWVEVSDVAAPAPVKKSKTTRTSTSATELAEGAVDRLANADIGPTLKAVMGPVYEALKCRARGGQRRAVDRHQGRGRLLHRQG